ncbi:MAG: nicotinamide-nucleotide adenylyltransferase [Candidatus Roizmanbacteria bacterium]|nr:nicotinamide-nucleotide adenylyltransferase [Candidatus Roizmanbacteria bacterium]
MKGHTALFIGRFQPFHHGHLAALHDLVFSYQEIFIVVGSSNENFTKDNPLTSGERLHLLRQVISHEGWEKSITQLIPFSDSPDNLLWTHRLIDCLPAFQVVCGNNELNNSLFQHLGYETERLPFRHRSTWQGSVIRQRIREHKSWNPSVPSYLVSLLSEFKFAERVQHAV